VQAETSYAVVQRTDEVAKLFERFYRLATGAAVRS
jgi:hypothetical protein